MNPMLMLPEGVDAPEVLARLGWPIQAFSLEAIAELERPTAAWVYLLPDALLHRKEWPRLRVQLANANRLYIVYGEKADSLTIVQAMRDGAFDFVYLSEDEGRWRAALDKAVTSQKLWLELFGPVRSTNLQSLSGGSPTMETLRKAIQRVGPTYASVLILGESGTGKERVAQTLHAVSGLQGPFVAINCAAIPNDLLEAELFGAERGAFTGALHSRAGLVEQAVGGTLFLDEIGELDLSMQPKLLRFLETRRARRVGGAQEYQVEVRLIAATNRDLERQIERSLFRADLYYRLAEVTLEIAPLRTRPEDIPVLATQFLDEANQKFGKHFVSIEPMLASAFMGYEWPGNVRELRAAVHRLAIMHDGAVLRREWWDPPVARAAAAPEIVTPPEMTGGRPSSGGPAGGRLSRQQKWQRAHELIEQSGHDLTWVAAQLGVHPTTLYRWIKSGKA